MKKLLLFVVLACVPGALCVPSINTYNTYDSEVEIAHLVEDSLIRVPKSVQKECQKYNITYPGSLALLKPEKSAQTAKGLKALIALNTPGMRGQRRGLNVEESEKSASLILQALGGVVGVGSPSSLSGLTFEQRSQFATMIQELDNAAKKKADAATAQANNPTNAQRVKDFLMGSGLIAWGVGKPFYDYFAVSPSGVSSTPAPTGVPTLNQSELIGPPVPVSTPAPDQAYQALQWGSLGSDGMSSLMFISAGINLIARAVGNKSAQDDVMRAESTLNAVGPYVKPLLDIINRSGVADDEGVWDDTF